MKEGFYVEDLLSELYYRNKAGNSFADVDSNKITPDMAMYKANSDKIEGTRLINKAKVLQLLNQYGPNWPIGNDVSGLRDTAQHCGYLRDIDVNSMPDLSGDTIDNTSKYHNIKISTLWLL